MRMSRPSDFSRASEEYEPGTFIMSPKVVTTTPGTFEISIARSMSRFAVTHTGQPGPERSRTLAGMTSRSPKRAMATVWVPQTSMRFMGRSAVVSMRSIR